MKHAILLSRCNALQRTEGNETFEQVKETMFITAIHKMVNYAAKDMIDAKLGKPYLLEFQLDLYAKEIEE